MNLFSFATRFDEEFIQDIVGRPAISILNTMNTDLARLSRLQSVLLNIYSPYELLYNKRTRNLIFALLKPEEATNLSSILNNDVAIPNPYDFLNSFRFKDYDFAKLFSFFELAILDEQEIIPFLQMKLLQAEYPLFEHQRKAVHELNTLLYSDNKRVLLHMPTGAGKTRTAMNVICNHFRLNEPTTVVWFANTEELCEQAMEEFEKAWKLLGNRELNAIRYWGGSNVDISEIKDGFIVAGLAKIYNLLDKSAASISKLAAHSSLIIMDEAHMAIAPTYKLILNTITSFDASLLGLSATPGRTWNDPDADEELAIFFGKKKVTLKIHGYNNPVDYLVENGYLAKVKNTSLLYNNGLEVTEADLKYLKDYLQLPDKFLLDLSQDQQRNILITKKVEELVTKHKRIILFALNVAHSNLLATVLQGRGINAFSVTSKTDPYQRKRLINMFKTDSEDTIVLCNYGILTTGFDAPKTSCAVIARPTDSLVLYSQMVGRAIRGINAGGNEEAEIVTVVDTSLPGFDQVANSFFNWEDVWE